jgi:hypothetical protein
MAEHWYTSSFSFSLPFRSDGCKFKRSIVVDFLPQHPHTYTHTHTGQKAYGFADGSIYLLDIESNVSKAATSALPANVLVDGAAAGPGTEAAHPKRHGAAIVHLAWAVQHAADPFDVREAAARCYDPSVASFLPPPESADFVERAFGGSGGDYAAAVSAAHAEGGGAVGPLKEAMGGKLEALVSADASGLVTVALHGHYHVASFSLPRFGPLGVGSCSTAPSSAHSTVLRVHSAAFDLSLASLTVWHASGALELDTSLLWSRRRQWAFLARKVSSGWKSGRGKRLGMRRTRFSFFFNISSVWNSVVGGDSVWYRATEFDSW